MGKLFNENNVDRVLSHSSRVKLKNNTGASDTGNSNNNINAEGVGEHVSSNTGKSKKSLKITHVGSARGTNTL